MEFHVGRHEHRMQVMALRVSVLSERQQSTRRLLGGLLDRDCLVSAFLFLSSAPLSPARWSIAGRGRLAFALAAILVDGSAS